MAPRTKEEQIIFDELKIIENITNIPITEVVDKISGNKSSANRFRGGFLRYDLLVKEAKKDDPYAAKPASEGSENITGLDANDAFKALTNASAEAIVYRDIRDSKSIFTTPIATVIHDPMAQGASIFSNLKLNQQLNNIGLQAYASFANKTPDLLVIASPQTIGTGKNQLTSYPEWLNLIDLDDSKNLNFVEDKDSSKTKILVSPVEVTTTGKPVDIKAKIKKFEDYGAVLFKNNPTVRYAPVLVLDYDKYMRIKDSQKKAIVKAMKKAGGLISLKKELYSNSKLLAKEAIDSFTPRIRELNKIPKAEKLLKANTQINFILQAPKPTIPQKLPFNESIARSKERDSKNDKSLSNHLFAKPKEWFQNLTQKLSSINKPVQQESAAEFYQRVTSNMKSNASFFHKMGVINPDHIDLLAASHAARTGNNPAKILKQSPSYQAKESADAKKWLKKMVSDAKDLSKESPSTAEFKKIVKSYDNAKIRLTSDVYQEMASSVKAASLEYPKNVGIDVYKNSQHLDLMIAKQLAEKDIAYEKILKQSPNYLSKEPAEAELWFENMLRNGKKMNKEYFLDSDGSQKIIRSYDNDLSRPPEKNDFEKLSDSVQKYNSSYSTDKKGLLVAVATAAIRAGKSPEEILQQSPDYLSPTVVQQTVEKAESVVREEQMRIEQQAERDRQRKEQQQYEW